MRIYFYLQQLRVPLGIFFKNPICEKFSLMRVFYHNFFLCAAYVDIDVSRPVFNNLFAYADYRN